MHKQTIYENEVRTKVVGRAHAARKDEGFLIESFVLPDLICVSLILDWNVVQVNIFLIDSINS